MLLHLTPPRLQIDILVHVSGWRLEEGNILCCLRLIWYRLSQF